MQDLNDLLRLMVEKKASDLHLRVGSQPLYRIHGALSRYGEERITLEWLSGVIDRVLSPRQRELLERELAVAGGAAHLELRIRVERIRHEAAHHHGIVDHEHSELRHVRLTSPAGG